MSDLALVLGSEPADQQVLWHQPATISVAWLDQNGAVGAPPDEVTVGITRADGTEVVAPLSDATITDDAVTFDLDADVLDVVDFLTALWTGSDGTTRTTTVEVVGGYYCTVNEIRGLPNLDNTTKFPDADLITTRRWFESTLEDYVGTCFVRRFRRVTLWGWGNDALLRLPLRDIRKVRAPFLIGTIAIPDEALSDLVPLADGRIGTITNASWPIWRERTTTREAITVAVEVGRDQPPRELKEAALDAILAKLLADHATRTEYATVTELGRTLLSVPGPNRPFGLPEVDRIANALRDEVQGPDGAVMSVTIG